MPTRRTRGTVPSPYRAGLVALAVAVTASAALAGSSRGPQEPERISVTAVNGSVSVTMAGSATHVQPNSTVGLPARIVTGDDGMLGLTQAGTNITIASDSDVEIPAEAANGQLIARLVQRRGNVFYNVAHRDVGTLRVETPFLVAVIKGTQFNVAAQADSTTISLFQGRLEIRTPDGSDIIQLNAGEIAIRGNADNSIRVLSMNERRVDAARSGEPFVALTTPGAGTSADGVRAGIVPVATGTRDAPTVAGRIVDSAQAALAPTSVTSGAGGALSAEPLIASTPTVHVDSGVSLGAEIGSSGPGVGASLDLGASSSLGASLNVGAVGSPSVSLGTSASVNVGSTGASLGTNLNVGAGSPSATVGANATLGGANLGATVSVGGASPGLLGTGVNVGLDLGNTGSATPSAATPPATASPAAPAPATPAVSLPALGAVTLPVLPVVTVPVAPAPTTPAPAQPTPPVLGVIGKLLGKP
jgi:FecR protein